MRREYVFLNVSNSKYKINFIVEVLQIYFIDLNYLDSKKKMKN